MGPVVVTCDGCGVRIRIRKPETALDRPCPRCSTPLADAVARAVESETAPPREETAVSLGINFELPTEPGRKSAPTSKPAATASGSGMPLLVACALVFVLSAAAIGYWLGAADVARSTASSEPNPAAPLNLEPPLATSAVPLAQSESPATDVPVSTSPPLDAPAADPAAPAAGDSNVSATEPMPSSATVAALKPLPTGDAATVVPPPIPTPEPPPPPAPTGAALASTARPVSPVPTPPMPAPDPIPGVAQDVKRVRIRTKAGATVVARVHGHADGKTSVLLPNGEIGFTTGTAETDEPFRPATRDELRQELTSAGPFANSQVLESEHYLVLYQSSTPFAEASIKLLESLYKNLTEAFKKREFPIHEAEFPLVAIIFRTEKEFRAHQQVDPDVQAYYEILSNRIYLYEKSDHDQQSPEVAALRKPQTVAHEGTHQILQNIGIHPRLAPWPIWLVEGFAEYCSPPTMTRRGASWGGLGQVNALHMVTIHDLDDPASLAVNGQGRPPLGRDRRKPLVEYLVTRSNLTPTDYALSWALTHYLAMKRGNEFLSFIQEMSQLPPLEERTPEQHLASFRAAFGDDLVKLDKTIAGYLSKLKYEPLPYYAVVFEQPIPGNQIRRATIVSQSPSMISQWLSQVSDANGGESSWRAFPHPTRARAQLAAEEWIRSH